MIFLFCFVILAVAIPLSAEVFVRGRDNVLARSGEEAGELVHRVARVIGRRVSDRINVPLERMFRRFATALFPAFAVVLLAMGFGLIFGLLRIVRTVLGLF